MISPSFSRWHNFSEELYLRLHVLAILEAYLDHFDMVLLSGFIALLKDLGVTFGLDLLDLC